MQDRKKVYVHSKDYSMFLQYKNAEENKDRDCEYIADDIFLRGRWPAQIIVEESAYQNESHQSIMESIETHRNLWRDELQHIEEREEFKTEEGEQEEEFYGV